MRKLIYLPLTALGYGLIVAVMLHMSWNAWASVITDFGNELFLPWRVVNGEQLYRDIDYYFGGPLSVYFNAFWFLIFGASMQTLLVVNGVMLLLLSLVIYRWLSLLSGRLAAATGVGIFFAVFAFSRYVEIGNYNYLTPYSHPLTHGLLLLFVLLLAFHRWQGARNYGRRSDLYLLATSIVWGLCLIGKFEIAVTSLAVGCGYLLALECTDRLRLRELIVIGVGLITPAAITLTLLCTAMPLTTALQGVFSQWIMLFDGRVAALSNLKFFADSMGLNDVTGNFVQMVTWSVFYVGMAAWGRLFAAIFAKERWWIAWSLPRTFATAMIAAIVLILAWMVHQPGFWLRLGKPLPLIMMAALIVVVTALIKHRDPRLALPFASVLLALGLLSKMIFHARVYHYGFVLAMPSVMLTVAGGLTWAPQKISRILPKAWELPAWPIRDTILMTILAVGIGHILVSHQVYMQQSFTIEVDGQRLRTTRTEGEILQATLDQLERRLHKGDTLLVLPEGAMLNFLLRRDNPTPYITFMPDLFLMYREADIINSLAADPPNYIVLWHKSTREYGYDLFGSDYARRLFAWITTHYRPVWQTESPPLRPGTRFGSAILKFQSGSPGATGRSDG